MLGDAINRLIKFYHKSLNEKISYAHLMCGEGGLVHALASIFSFGYKSVRLFGRNLSVWDFFLKVTMDFNQSIAGYLAANASPMGSPVKQQRVGGGGASTLENPRRRNASLSNLLDSPRRTPAAVLNAASAIGARSGGSGGTPQGTLSRANQFRR